MKNPENYIVEYRDVDLIRHGQIPSTLLDLKFKTVINGVGTWSVALPAEHKAAIFLRKPGSGIIITDSVSGEVLMSGPTQRPHKKQTSADPTGIQTISGISDDCILWDALAYPQPSNADVTTQTESHDVRTGDAESLMRQYVAFNIGGLQAAPERIKGYRRFIGLEPVNKQLGPVLTKRARFPVLGDLLKEIAVVSGLKFRLVQRGLILRLEITPTTDRTKTIRLDVVNGTLDEQSVETSGPSVSRVIVAGQGEGVERTIIERQLPEGPAHEDAWGRVIERFKDQRNTNVLEELQTAGDEDLEEDGKPATSLKAIPSNDQSMIYLKHWAIGDKITVVVDGQETASTVTEAAFVVNSSGVTIGAAIGDVTGFNSASALEARVADTESKVSKLEREAEQALEEATVIKWGDIQEKPTSFPGLTGVISEYGGDVAPAGHLLCQGQLVLRADYPALYSVLGDKYGVNDGSTNFVIPDRRKRVAVGLDSTDADFNPIGKTGGAKTHTLTVNEIPAHQHQQTFNTGAIAAAGGSAIGGMASAGSGAAANAQQLTNNTGGGLAHNNLQPYIVMNYIIKT